MLQEHSLVHNQYYKLSLKTIATCICKHNSYCDLRSRESNTKISLTQSNTNKGCTTQDLTDHVTHIKHKGLLSQTLLEL